MSLRFPTTLTLTIALAIPALGAPAAPKDDDQKTLYAIGAMVASEFWLEPKEVRYVTMGLEDAAKGRKLKAEPGAYRDRIGQLQSARADARNKAFLDKAAKENGAERLPSGLIIKTLKAGTGLRPKATDKVKVHYHGTFPDGRIFDSSVQRGQPSEFPLNGVVRCWTEGVQKMRVGEKAKLTCPYQVAYGERGRPPAIPPKSTLIFEVELLDIVKPLPDTGKADREGFLEKAAKEKGARTFPSGLIIKTLKRGKGASPKATDRVKVHYHGTFPDGKVFDSSVDRGQPSSFPLNGVIKCWTEGVQKMKVGEKARLVCPYSIAYGERGRPPTIPAKSTLVFEVELLDILK